MSEAGPTMATKKRALGRGLDALLPGGDAPAAPPPAPAAPKPATQTARIEELHPTEGQPRSVFNQERLEELAQSIRELGVLEPILVRKRAAGGFHIIAGERRWRASQKAGLHEVPIWVRELSDDVAFEAALVENLQREDLNPIETARAFQRLVEEHGHTAESIADRVGKSRPTVTNSMRLLGLPAVVLDMIEAGELSEGHGRALLGANEEKVLLTLARAAAAKGWSVRETERQVRFLSAPRPKPGEQKSGNANLRDLESRLRRSLGAKVQVADRNGKGHLKISYTSADERERILEQLLR